MPGENRERARLSVNAAYSSAEMVVPDGRAPVMAAVFAAQAQAEALLALEETVGRGLAMLCTLTALGRVVPSLEDLDAQVQATQRALFDGLLVAIRGEA